jgi:hypothetical protein
MLPIIVPLTICSNSAVSMTVLARSVPAGAGDQPPPQSALY